MPILIVDGDPADYITDDYYEDGTQVAPVRTTVRIDGDLPTVTDNWPTGDDGHFVRPLREGDRVTLATECSCDFGGRTRGEPHEAPFATATVADIDRDRGGYEGDWAWFVSVTDVGRKS